MFSFYVLHDSRSQYQHGLGVDGFFYLFLSAFGVFSALVNGFVGERMARRIPENDARNAY